MISTIFWDVDGTLLDFQAAQSAAIKGLFHDFSLGECTDELLLRYTQINDSFWRKLEQNEITKQQVLVGRFEQFFQEIGVPASLAPEFNRQYLPRLGETIVFRDDSYHIVQALRGRIRQYVVSNGTTVAQNKKLALSGLGVLMDGIFLSEEIGVEKPNRAFFDAVLDRIGPVNVPEILIVGDSLTSDIRGGMNAGIKTCWYNPDHKEAPEAYRIDYTIADLHEVLEITAS